MPAGDAGFAPKWRGSWSEAAIVAVYGGFGRGS